MNTLEQLLARWEEGSLTPEDAAELKRLLADPHARKALVDDWMFYEAICGALQAQSGLGQQEIAAPAATPVAVASLTLGERLGGWLAQLTRPSWRWAAAGAVAAALVVAFYSFLPSEPVARFIALQGEVLVEQAGKAIPAAVGQQLYSGDVLRVSAGGGAIIAWPQEQTLVKLWPGARFQLHTRKGVKQLALAQGQLLAVVAPQPSGKPLTVRTPQAEAVVKGTRFTIAVADQATRLEVMEGAVAMRSNSPDAASPVTVTPGNFAVATRGVTVRIAALTGRATRDLIALPPGSDPLAGVEGRVIWSETVDRLDVRGWPLGVAAATSRAYQQRLRGFLAPPADGEYAFWISSASSAEFWLSTDDQPENRRRITVAKPGAGNADATTTLTGQAANAGRKSAPQKLMAGKRVYFEVLHQIGAGEPVAVGWVRPGSPAAGSLIEIIGGEALSPWIEPPR